LNPRLPPCGLVEEDFDWEKFRNFLSKRCCERVVGDRMRYAKKYSSCLVTNDFSIITEFSDCKRGHTLNQNSEELILARMEKTRTNGNVLGWIKKVREYYPILKDFLEFILVSGLRFTEAVHSYNLIVELSRKSKIDTYYSLENQFLEHYRFKHLFIRRTKKVFISYVPKKIVSKISKNEKISAYQIGNWISRNKELNSRFGDIREYWATFMTKFLNPAEIDYLQGRVSASVFMRNYFNPSLIEDLKERVFKGISELEKKMRYVKN